MAITMTVYLALLNAYTPATGAAPASYTEVSGTGYGRSGAIAATYDAVANTLLVPAGATFAATGSNWTAAVAVGAFDAASGGNLLMAWPQSSVTVASGASLTLPATTLAMVAGIFATPTPAGTVIGTSPAGTAITAGVALAAATATAIAAGTQAALVTLAYAATITPDASKGLRQKVTLTGNVTVNVPTNMLAGQTMHLEIVQDGTGNRTFTKGSGLLIAGGAPTASTAAGAIDLLRIAYDGVAYRAEYLKAFA